MANMMPGDNSGADPRPHDPRCAALCALPLEPWALALSPYRAVERECADGHREHCCTCDDLAELDADAAAEAWCDGWETRS